MIKMADHMEIESFKALGSGGGGGADKRLNHRYPQYTDRPLHSDNYDYRPHYHHINQQPKKMATDVAELRSELERVKEERDKYEKQLEKSRYLIPQNNQLQAYVQQLKYEKDQLSKQLHQVVADQEQSKTHIVEDLKRARSELDCVIQDRDDYKYKVKELQREKERLTEKLQSLGPNYDISRSTASSISELKTENAKLKEKLERSQNNKEVLELKEANKRLSKELDTVQQQLKAAETEIMRLKKPVQFKIHASSSEESIEESKRHPEGVGGSDESLQRHVFGRSHSHSHSVVDLHTKRISSSGQLHPLDSKNAFGTKKQLSSSTSNLLEDKRTENIIPQLQAQLSKAFHDKESLSQQVSEMRTLRVEMETKLKMTETENESLRDQLSRVKVERATAHEEMKVVKGMSMQQTTETYEKSMQLQTQLLELKTEKTLAEKQRDIAIRERDRVLTDAIQVKKKLETIKAQRQKDAKELSAMRKLKDKTVSESQESVKQLKELKNSLQEMEKSSTEIVNGLRSITGSQRETEAKSLLGIMKQQRSDYNAMLRLLYGRELVDDVTSSAALAKLETFFQEKSNLLVEVEDLQRSASKQNEDYIFDLKQTIEELYMEQDTLKGKNRSMMSRIGKLENERDKLRQECERLDKQCQELNATLTFPSANTEPHPPASEHIEWGENWEMKHIQIPLGTEGKAGFSVVGGKDQPQLPNPGSFIVTTVGKGGPADGILKVGDVLESVNGHSLNNAHHAQAVAVVKESKGLLDIVVRRRKNAHALQVGVAGAVMELGEGNKKKTKSHEFALMLQKDGFGFNYDWETHYCISNIIEGGPADQILQAGDRILQVNGASVSKEKPNSVKKLLKPNKGVLRIVIEREEESSGSQLLVSAPPPPHSISEMFTTSKSASGSSDDHSSSARNTYRTHAEQHTDVSSWCSDDYGGTQNSQDQIPSHHHSRQDSYHSATQESNASQEPVKIEGPRSHLRSGGRCYIADPHRPTSDGLMYTSAYPVNNRRVEFEELSSEVGSTDYSEGVSESFLSEPSSYPYMPLESSQTSIELTFHSVSQVSHNRLTVQSTVSTQPEKEIHSDDDESYFARDDGTRTTFRTRSGSDGLMMIGAMGGSSQFPELENSSRNLKKSSKKTHSKFSRGKKSWKSGSLSQLSEPQYDQYADSKKRSRSKSMLAIRGRSRSNLSLTGARSMTSVQEEPRRSTSSSNVMDERDPLSDAIYIRANFAYIPRLTQELNIQPGDVFHIIEDAPVRYRRSFWVSRLNEDGTDAGVGAIPNTARAQEWLNEQGNSLDIALYEEVEAYTGTRPVLVCGVLANQITNLLVESYPKLFHYCHPEFVEGTARIIEARLHREQSEGRIIHYERHGDTGFAVIPREAFTSDSSKGKHVLVGGSIASLHRLKTFAPPISILVKAGAEDSINTFGPDKLSTLEVQRMYAEARMLEEEHSHEFTACLMLVFEDTLLRQIADIVRHEKMNQAWVPVVRQPISP